MSDAAEPRALPCGDGAVLLEVEDLEAVRRLRAALVADPPDWVRAVVPAARTVLVRVDPAAVGVAEARRWALEHATADAGGTSSEAPGEPLEVPVTYDGDDLEDVAAHVGATADEVVETHLATTWRVAFCGFAPGFGYLVADEGPASDGRLEVPRLEEPRTRVPAGSVGLAAELCGLYPRSSPGGWRLIGRTEIALFDVERDPPALLVPGREVRFVRAHSGPSLDAGVR